MQCAWENEYSFQNQQKKTYSNSPTNLLIELSNLFFFILIIYALVELGNEEKLLSEKLVVPTSPTTTTGVTEAI